MKHLNRQKRFLADRDESSLSMGYAAAIDVLEKTNTRAEEIDMILYITLLRYLSLLFIKRGG